MPFQGDVSTGFQTNASTTWSDIGIYTTDLETQIGINANGYSKVLGSLTLGGYDSSRLSANGTIFPFASDDSKPLQVGVTQITARNTLLGSATLYSTGYFSLIDSTIPHIWMPAAACDNFATNFGLNYDNQTDLYLINDTMHSKLTNLNPEIIFKLSPQTTDGGESVNIVLPYAAFALQASYPYYQNSTRYFPIRRAANDSQYILGRTFLQEAYLIADYERANFTIAQAAFANPMPAEKLVSILPPGVKATNSTGGGGVVTRPDAVLSRNVIIGIAVGVVAGAALVLFIFATAFYIRRRRRQRITAALPLLPSSETSSPQPPNFSPPAEVDARPKLELPSDSEAALNELPTGGEKYGWVGPQEVQGSLVERRVEMRGGWEPPELDGRGVKGAGGGRMVYELEGSEPVLPQQQQQRGREGQGQQREREEERPRFSWER
ncbi:acid protease [Aureobasidium pullulans]|nr:acid protease [Aureobasidium pullulans]